MVLSMLISNGNYKKQIQAKKKGRNSLIEYKDVVKKYDGDTLANDHISLKIEQGDFVYVVGPSGAEIDLYQNDVS